MLPHIPLNLPNLLSLYRLLSFPVVLGLALAGQEKAFAALLCINLITDILDGLLARLLRQETEIGARIDSLADTGVYITAFLGIFIFKADDFMPHILSFSLFMSLFVSFNLFSLVKFGRMPSLHLYSTKMGGYIQGLFFFLLFAQGFSTPFYYFMVAWGMASFTEHILVQIMLDRMQSNARGLYWVWKGRRQGST